MEKIFIDTNIIVYANDKRIASKQKKAIEIVKSFNEKSHGHDLHTGNAGICPCGDY